MSICFSIKYDSNYVSKNYITFQEKMWTEFVRAYIQIQKKSFLLNNLKVLNIVCLRKTTIFLDYLYLNRLKTKKSAILRIFKQNQDKNF